MDRVRAGLAGLGLVFLFTSLASVAFAPSRAVEQAGGQTGGQAKAPGEPLAQLGVAPSNDKDSNATPVEAPPMVAERPTAGVPDAALSTLERGLERGETPAAI